MGLDTFEPFKQEVTSNGKVIATVRGLSLDDLAVLMRLYGDQIGMVIDMARTATDTFGSAAFLIEAAQQAPNLVFAAILLATDTENTEAAAVARKMPLGLQVTIMQATLEMTVEDIGGPKAALALVKQMFGSRKSLPAADASKP